MWLTMSLLWLVNNHNLTYYLLLLFDITKAKSLLISRTTKLFSTCHSNVTILYSGITYHHMWNNERFKRLITLKKPTHCVKNMFLGHSSSKLSIFFPFLLGEISPRKLSIKQFTQMDKCPLAHYQLLLSHCQGTNVPKACKFLLRQMWPGQNVTWKI